MARVAGLHRLSLRVSDLDKVGAFYRDVWGMRLADRSEGRWLLQSRESASPDLCLEARPGVAGLSALGLRIAGVDDIAPLLAAAQQQGGRVVRGAGMSPHFAAEYGAALADPDGNRIELTVAPETGAKPAALLDGAHAIGPLRIGHVVLWTPRIDAMEAFYAALGLRVSDRTAVGMSFLRCSTDHHSVALARHPSKTGLQHVAFDVGSIDAVMREKGRLTAAGVECIWGPGRHGPGNNVFSYYTDPAGTVIEFYGDMQKVSPEELAEPVYWGPEHRGDIWGVAGPPPQAFRA